MNPFFGNRLTSILPNDMMYRKKPFDFSSLMNPQPPTGIQGGMQSGNERLPIDSRIQEPTLLDRYREVIGNRPQRDALVSHLQEGGPNPDEYKPSWKRRLGAMLAGAAAGASNPQTGFQIAANIANRPYDDARFNFDKRTKELTSLNDIEGSNVDENLREIEIGRIMDADAREREAHNLQMRTGEQNLDIQLNEDARAGERAERDKWQMIESIDGHTYAVNIDNPTERRDLGVTAETPPEEFDRQMQILERQERLRTIDREDSQAHAFALADHNNELIQGRESQRQENRIALVRARLTEQLNNPDAPEAYRQKIGALHTAMAVNPDLVALIDFDETTGTVIPVKERWYFDEEDKRNLEVVKTILAGLGRTSPIDTSGGGGGLPPGWR